MSEVIHWPEQYAALIARLPEIVERSRLTVGGFSACVDVYLSLREAIGPLSVAARDSAEGAAMLAELMRRATSGVGGELFVDWPAGPAWIDRQISGRRAVGGTSAQAAYMLAQLGAPALIAIEDRSASQLDVLHPNTLAADADGLVHVASLQAQGAARAPHYIFEFTAGETIGAHPVPRSSRTIVRFDHSALQRDHAFERSAMAQAKNAGAGILCGFNEIPPESAATELDYAAGIADTWRRAGLDLIHVELGDFPDEPLRDATIDRLLPKATSVGMSGSELAELSSDREAPETAAIRIAETHGLSRACIHADGWAFAVTRGDPERELEALQVGCLLASTRAAQGYFAIPDRVPDSARFPAPPLPISLRRGSWSIACCPAPYLEKPAATIGLGDTFLAGTLVVLGGATKTAAAAVPTERPS
ncbi:MAG: 6-phosphofructokinase [Bauldia sp.]|nr:6-phosphofructokinase [Bauldia sp.]